MQLRIGVFNAQGILECNFTVSYLQAKLYSVVTNKDMQTYN